MKILVVSADNGKGLTKDIAVLREALGDLAEIEVVGYGGDPKTPPYDLAIFLEHVSPRLIGRSRVNWYMPNPEWHRSGIDGIDLVIAKTRDCESIFSGHPTAYVGWASPDFFDASVPKQMRLLHVAGGSSMKGTAQVIEAMRRLPHLALDLVSRTAPTNMPSNVTWYERVPEEDLRMMMNRAALHLCPSSYEGFGHYINEARSVGAAIVSTNAAPMNELVTDFGFLASYNRTSVESSAVCKHVCPDSLAWMIRLATQKPLEELVAMGREARAAYFEERAAFRKRIRDLVQRVSPRSGILSR